MDWAQIFPLLMTAAGTLRPSRVVVLGVGVAGLQAIATARRLGALVYAYDVRDVVREQVESLGARFIELDLDTAELETAGGYARSQSDEFLARQRDQLGRELAAADAVITTALVAGARAPVLVTKAMLEMMRPGSVLVDLAAAKGGNCELTKPDQTIVHKGVAVIGLTDGESQLAVNASQMYSRNLTRFLCLLAENDGDPTVDGNPRRRIGYQRRQGGKRCRGEPVGIGRWLVVGNSARTGRPMEPFIALLTVFALAVLLGLELITKVPPTLHTPLMSGANAISGITIVGGLNCRRRRGRRHGHGAGYGCPDPGHHKCCWRFSNNRPHVG